MLAGDLYREGKKTFYAPTYRRRNILTGVLKRNNIPKRETSSKQPTVFLISWYDPGRRYPKLAGA